MELDELIDGFVLFECNEPNEEWHEQPVAIKDYCPQETGKRLASDILTWIKEKMPKIGGEQTVYVQGMNSYRQQVFKNLGIKENKDEPD